MKQKILSMIALVLLSVGLNAQQSYAPFLKTMGQSKTIEVLSHEIAASLSSKGFEIIGEYNPMQSDNLLVLCFTRKDLQETSLSFEDRGALASVLKIGLQKVDDKVVVSLQNPMYMFYAYFRGDIEKQKTNLSLIDADAKSALVQLYGELSSFGGQLTVEKLQNYHYKVMMPYFDDPNKLESYDSFEEGLAYIQEKLRASSKLEKVYVEVFSKEKVAVFGIGLKDIEKGESRFLPIIGDSHLAAMPYEIILQGNEATMLAGKYRIALHWPELTMGTFMKIMSTPGDIEDAFKEITEK